MPHEVSESSTEAMKGLKEALTKLETAEGRKKGLGFQPSPDDVFIVSPPKCGTTWLQQIVHGLRSNGDMNFDEIGLVIPHIEIAYDCGYTDLCKPQGYLPRVYKTHSWFDDCPKGAGKYVFVVRNPEDTAVSFYNFFNGWFFTKDTISLDDFVLEFFTQRGSPENNMQNASYWHILTSWFSHLHDGNLLWLHYEDLVEDLPGCIDLISNFLGIGVCDEELKAKIVYQASYEFMKAHASKFDDHHLKGARNEACGLPRNAGLSNAKVMAGASRSRLQLSIMTKHVLDKKWESIVLPLTGFACYKDLRAEISKTMHQKFGAMD